MTPNFDGAARWNPNWQAFHFVAGHRRSEESFCACLVQIAEELGLHERHDYTVLASPPLDVDFTAWSVSARTETRYVMELFEVELAPPRSPGSPPTRRIAGCVRPRSEVGSPRTDARLTRQWAGPLTEGRLWRDDCQR